MKVFWLFNHPAPYKVDFFNELGKSCDLEVTFERASEFGRNSVFYGRKIENFKATFCKKTIVLGTHNNWTPEPKRIIAKSDYDLLVMNGYRTVSERHVISYLKRHHKPYILYINGGIAKVKENPLKKWFKSKYIKGATAYYCPDENSAEYLVHYGADKDKITIYPYSSIFDKDVLDRPCTYEEKLALRKKLSLNGEKIFISSGQFIERKNYEELIAIWKKVPSDWTLVITGEGKLKEQYLEEIKTLGLKNVVLLPYKPHDELFELYRASDAFVFLSKEDIYGHVINEALSQGLPVISSDQVNAAKHLIENGKNGYVVPLDDEEKIVSAIKSVGDIEMEKSAIATAKLNTMEISAQFHIEKFKEFLDGQK
ncbi:MAG: glycosyltransferase family 4 protein [Bacilli bacterium]|nr:glycosyltransferase family 4 protein [Bacilli bacterium]